MQTRTLGDAPPTRKIPPANFWIRFGNEVFWSRACVGTALLMKDCCVWGVLLSWCEVSWFLGPGMRPRSKIPKNLLCGFGTGSLYGGNTAPWYVFRVAILVSEWNEHVTWGFGMKPPRNSKIFEPNQVYWRGKLLTDITVAQGEFSWAVQLCWSEASTWRSLRRRRASLGCKKFASSFLDFIG